MDIILKGTLVANSAAGARDVVAVKRALNRLGYYTPYEDIGITDIPDRGLFEGVAAFQKDRGLAVTGEIRPDDDTLRALNAGVAAQRGHGYIWRTVKDAKVRPSHAAREGKLYLWGSPDYPGKDYNCRCWAEEVSEEYKYKDAIEPTIGPFDIFLGGLLVKGGLRIGILTLTSIYKIARLNPDLNQSQLNNLARFIKKIPANSKENVKVIRSPNGNVKFSATSSGKVPGSKAVYEKTVDSNGKTVGYRKITYDQNGRIVHVKDKIK